MKKSQQVKVIRTDKNGETIIGIAARLANNSAYMRERNLQKAPLPIPIGGAQGSASSDKTATENEMVEPDFEAMKADALVMEVPDLAHKYLKEHWEKLARDLGLRGNHSNTGEINLVDKVKSKLEE